MAFAFKRSLAAALLVASCAIASAVGAQDQSADAKRNPIQIPGAAWAFDGFLVTMPNDTGWYSIAKDLHYADLSKDFADGLKAAVVVEARKLDEPVGKQQELLKRLQQDHTTVPEPGMKLLDYQAEPFSPKGALCAHFASKLDDQRPNFAAPGRLLVRGVACVPPDQSQVIVTVRYAQRAAIDEWSPALRALGDPVLDSLRFLPTNDAVLKQAREAMRGEHAEQAVQLLTPSATEGDADAALFLGNIYLYGRGVPPDYQQARRWLELASKEGRIDALYNLGAIYDKGIGVERDTQQALHWFTLAADQRDAQAQLNLALIYLNGSGVPRDLKLGEQWLRRSAANGSKRAQGLLGVGPFEKQ